MGNWRILLLILVALGLIILALCAAAIVAGVLFARKQPLEKLAKILLGIGMGSEFIKVFYYILANEATHGGALPKTDLPFHLCSIQLIFMAILVFSSNQKLKNLLLAGRNVSADSTAAGAIRVMPPCMGMGQASGTAAALAVKQGITPRQVDAQELRSVLKANGAYL